MLREKLKSKLNAASPSYIDTVIQILKFRVATSQTLQELENDIASQFAVNSRPIAREHAALVQFIKEPPGQQRLLELVENVGNWPLEEHTDKAALEFFNDILSIYSQVLD